MSEDRARKADIDWAFWLGLREVKAWQAVLLSLGIDPDAMEHLPEGWMAGPGTGPFFKESSFPDSETKEEYGKRLRLLLSNYSDRRHFSAGTLNFSSASDCGVRLQEVAAWLIHINRKPESPPELASIASAPVMPQPPPTTATPSESAANNDKPWRSYARKRMLALKKQRPDLNDGEHAETVATELQQNKIFGRGDRPVTAATILRHWRGTA